MDDTKYLTDEQVEDISRQMDEEIKGTPLEDLANMPSNQGKLERSAAEVTEQGQSKNMQVIIDPNTGEHKLLGQAKETEEESFEEFCERIENSDVTFDQSPFSDSEIKDYINQIDSTDQTMFGEMKKDFDISTESITALLDIVNRKMNKEEFNIYKAFPDEVRNMVDRYLEANQMGGNSMQSKQIRNLVSESLIDEFITNIGAERIKKDFNKEVEEIFSHGMKELGESIVGYTLERNNAYRKYAEGLEDSEKKEKMIAILDQIDKAYSLEDLKEFAKKCKIKKFDLERPSKIYTNFLTKYENSQYNIYDLNMARPILFRNLNIDSAEEYTQKDIDSFLVLYCKYCQNMKPDNALDHAFMYYVIYNIIIVDMNRSGESKEISDIYLNNIKEVIKNIKQRNNF